MVADPVFIDTNVLIYACDKADPKRQQLALDLVAGASDGLLQRKHRVAGGVARLARQIESLHRPLLREERCSDDADDDQRDGGADGHLDEREASRLPARHRLNPDGSYL